MRARLSTVPKVVTLNNILNIIVCYFKV